jgi:hypothetical protein
MKKSVAVLALLFLANLAHAGATECTQEFPGSVPLESGHRAYVLLKTLQVKIGIQAMSIQLCVREENGKSSQMASRQWKSAAIVASRLTLNTFSDTALIGALAHELGHILKNTRKPQSARGVKREDRMVDAFAIKLVGTEPLRAAYIEHTHDRALADRRVSRALKLVEKESK